MVDCTAKVILFYSNYEELDEMKYGFVYKCNVNGKIVVATKIKI